MLRGLRLKLTKIASGVSRRLETSEAKVKHPAKYVEALVDLLGDAGSIPAASTIPFSRYFFIDNHLGSRHRSHKMLTGAFQE